MLLMLASRSEATLQDVLDTLHNSDFFPRTGKDAPSRFWSAYERVAKQHDDEFIERLNGEMDVLLIFVRATFFVLTWVFDRRHLSGWFVLGS